MSARFMTRLLRAGAATLLVTTSLGAAACAVHQPAPQPVRQIPMTPQAAETYFYLVLNEAARNNDVRAGTEAIRNLLTLNPDVSVYVEAARFFGLRKDMISLREVVKDGLENYPENFDLILLLAQSYAEENRQEESVNLLREYIRNHPEHVHARQQLAQLYISEKRFQDAVDLLKAPSAAREEPVTRYHLARALAQLKQYKEAESELKKAIKASPEFMEAWAELAFVYELKKDYVAAETTYGRILEMGQNGQEIWLRLIALNIKLNHPEKALDIAKEGPEETGFILQVATMFIEEGFPEQARELLEPLAEENNPPDEVFFHLALIAFNHDKDPEQAVALLENIPDHSRLWSKAVRFRGHLLYQLDRREDAIALLRQGLRTDPGDREFWALLIDMLANDKQLDEAIATVDEALKRWPDDAELLFTKGSIYDVAGERDKATAIMEHVITIDPEHPGALNFVGYVLAERGEDLDRALVLIETALKYEPDSDYILDSLAWVHYKLGNIDLAWETIKRTVAPGTKHASIWEHYGDIAKALGRKKDARKGYREALKYSPENPAELKKKLQEL